MADQATGSVGDRPLPTCGVRREVLDGLDHLSRVTGLSVSYLIRSVLEQHLVGLGLLAPVETTPTKRKARTK